MRNKFISGAFTLILTLSLALLAGCSEPDESPRKFTIGGTASGIIGSLVLRNNGADELTISADGAFVFATSQEDSTAYNITVLTPPAGRICVVSNGSGVVAGADITSVSVACSINGSQSYTIGGTASGLTGTLVLRNNGAGDLTISADGAFVFAAGQADGTVYDVTVLTPPAGQTCVVSNGSGVLAGADITNVSVVCSAGASGSYTIGGTVSGLTGILVLQNNGADDLTISSGGAFTFATGQQNAAAYDVTVLTHPSGQTCAVSNGSGVVAGADITGVTVSCSAGAGNAVDTTPPAIGFTSHTDGEFFNGTANVTFAGTLADDSTITEVVASVDGTDVAAAGVASDQTSFSFTATVTEGAHEVRVDATDAAGNTTFLSISVTYDNTTPALAITGPADGSKYTDGNRNVVVMGTFADANLADLASNITVIRNGVAVDPVPAITDGGAGNFSFPFTLGNNSNVIAIELTDDAGNVTIVSVNLIFPYLEFTNGQDATVVIGQIDFDTATINGADGNTSAKGFDTPWGSPTFANGILYLPDSSNHRVLGYNAIPAANNAGADFVIGQVDLDSSAFSDTATGLGMPNSVATDGGKFVVAEGGNNRVIIYDALPTGNTPVADIVVGAAGFEIYGFGCTADTFMGVGGAAIAGGKLFVADSGGNRVLIWNTIPATHGEPADVVLGQVDDTTCDLPVNAANTLAYPTAVWSDGTRLIVADQDGTRLLIWNTIPTTVNANADLVLGQVDFTTMGWGEGAGDFGGLESVTSNGNQIFVVDRDGSRIMVWNTFPTTNGEAADVVLGQADFGAGFSSPATAINRLNGPTGLTIAGDKLIVTDTFNNRYMIFQGAP